MCIRDSNDTLDLRLTDIDFNTDAKLELGYDYGKANLSDLQEKDPGYTNQKGHLVTVQHIQGNWFGGFNKLCLLYTSRCV